jgi:mRNA-degrading endonuclease RelE of RelBE toxin-antitoxin system
MPNPSPKVRPARRLRVEYTESADRRLDELGPTVAEIDAIVAQLRELATNPKAGYLVPFLSHSLYRLDIGRFALIYTIEKNVVKIVDVFIP